VLQLRSKSGFTFIEVLVATVISVIGASVFFFFAQQARTHKSGVDYSLSVKELLADNVIEVKGAELVDLPSSTQCLVRTYTNKKLFISETMIATNPCPAAMANKDQFQIMWEVKDTNAIVATFNTSGLKLPVHSNPLRQIIVHAWSYRDPNKAAMDHNQIVIYKR
jgi:prepilin-type N-terminal cleavage/methylation domain-containing protein